MSILSRNPFNLNLFLAFSDDFISSLRFSECSFLTCVLEYLNKKPMNAVQSVSIFHRIFAIEGDIVPAKPGLNIER